jgi:hypothetical protein
MRCTTSRRLHTRLRSVLPMSWCMYFIYVTCSSNYVLPSAEYELETVVTPKRMKAGSLVMLMTFGNISICTKTESAEYAYEN